MENGGKGRYLSKASSLPSSHGITHVLPIRLALHRAPSSFTLRVGPLTETFRDDVPQAGAFHPLGPAPKEGVGTQDGLEVPVDAEVVGVFELESANGESQPAATSDGRSAEGGRDAPRESCPCV